MIDALDIDPDDDVEIVLEVEAAFGITISESDAAGCETVGDLFKVVCAHVPTVERSDHLPCPTAQAFTALCRAIRLRQPDHDLRPDTRIASFAGPDDHSGWHAHLAMETGLNIPAPTLSLTAVGIGCGAFAVAAALTGKFLGETSHVLVACLLEGSVIALLVRRYAPSSWSRESWSTLGDLARETASRNIAQAVAAHGAIRRRDAWQALVTVLRPYTQRAGKIAPDTRFFARSR